MNRKSFYLEIGNIDDDLIQEASESRGHRLQISFARLAGMAACLCLTCTVMFFGIHRDIIYYNEAPAPLASKVLVPSDENTTVHQLTYQELFAYYGLEPFPDVLMGLQKLEQTYYFVYQSSDNTIYDTNILNYRSDDGKQTLSIVLAKNGSDDTIEAGNIKKSKIDGVSLVLAVSEKPMESSAQSIYWAKIYNQGIFLRVVSSGIDETAFTKIIRELIKCQQ